MPPWFMSPPARMNSGIAIRVKLLMPVNTSEAVFIVVVVGSLPSSTKIAMNEVTPIDDGDGDAEGDRRRRSDQQDGTLRLR